MGLFNNEEEERERRRAAEANEQAEWHKRRAAEANLKAVEEQLDREQWERWEREEKEEKAALRAMTKSGRGDSIFDLVQKYDEDGKQKDGNAAKAIRQWQVPTDKENFVLFAKTLNINYDYFKQVDWIQSGLDDFITDKFDNAAQSLGLRRMLLNKGKQVAKVHLRGQVPEALELLDEVEQRLNEERTKDLNLIKWAFIALVAIFAFSGIMAMCEG